MSEINCMNCAICAFKETLCDRCDEMKRLGSAEDVEKALIGAFSETNDDCISRQAAIKEAESWVAVDGREKHLQKDVIEWLKGLPSAQPDIIRCKDCAKRKYCRTSTVWAVPPSDDWFCADATSKGE